MDAAALLVMLAIVHGLWMAEPAEELMVPLLEMVPLFPLISTAWPLATEMLLPEFTVTLLFGSRKHVVVAVPEIVADAPTHDPEACAFVLNAIAGKVIKAVTIA